MSLTPHEENALAALEEGLRADDPALAAALGASPRRLEFVSSALTVRHVLALVLALGGAIAAGALAGSRPALLAVATGALVVPWLVWTARSTARGARSFAPLRRLGSWPRTAVGPLPIGYGGMALTVVLLLVAFALLPPIGRAVVGLVIVFVVAPWIIVRVVAWLTSGKPR